MESNEQTPVHNFCSPDPLFTELPRYPLYIHFLDPDEQKIGEIISEEGWQALSDEDKEDVIIYALAAALPESIANANKGFLAKCYDVSVDAQKQREKVMVQAQWMRQAFQLDEEQIMVVDAQGWQFSYDLETHQFIKKFSQFCPVLFEEELSPLQRQTITNENIEALNNQLLFCFLIMPDFPGETLFEFYHAMNKSDDSLSVQTARWLAVSMADTLDMIHRLGVAHGDFHLDNLLWDQAAGKLRLIDFEHAGSVADTILLRSYIKDSEVHWLLLLLICIYQSRQLFDTTENTLSLVNVILGFMFDKAQGRLAVVSQSAIPADSLNISISAAWLDQVAYIANVILLFSLLPKIKANNVLFIQLETLSRFILTSSDTSSDTFSRKAVDCDSLKRAFSDLNPDASMLSGFDDTFSQPTPEASISSGSDDTLSVQKSRQGNRKVPISRHTRAQFFRQWGHKVRSCCHDNDDQKTPKMDDDSASMSVYDSKALSSPG